MQEEFSLKEFYQIIKKYLLTIMIAIISGMIVSVLIMIFFITPKYTSEAQLLVNQQSSQQNIQVSEIQSNIQMINTYRDIITGHSVLSQVNENLNNEFTVNQLKEAIVVEQGQNSQAFKVKSTMSSPEDAQIVVNELIMTFETTISDIYGDVEASIFILSPATFNANKVSPKLIVFALIGAVIGLILSVLIILIAELMDTTIKDDDYLVQLGLINLGHVYELSSKELKQSRLSANKKNDRSRERI